MKAVVFLALLGVAAARPQFVYPYSTPLVTVKAADDSSKAYTPITYTYPTTAFGNYPMTYSGFPYGWPTYPFAPVIASPVEEKKESRSKRSAEAEPEPEPEADPFTIYTSGIPFTGTTTYNYPTTFPFASAYSTFPSVPFTYSYPYTFPFKYAKAVKTA